MENRIVLNRVKCLACGDILTSHHRYDFVSCRCTWVSIDGGRDYLKRLGDIDACKELSVFSSADFSLIRKSLHRGSRGKDGRGELTWIPLSEISDKYLQNLLDFVNQQDQNHTYDAEMYQQEKDYRKLNNISVSGE